MAIQNLRPLLAGEPPYKRRRLDEDSEKKDPVTVLPSELIMAIFSHLNEDALRRCGRVNRQWRELSTDQVLWNAFDLKKISPLLRVLDESDWETYVDMAAYGLSTSDLTPLDKRTTIPFLRRCLHSLPIEGNKGITLLTIPAGLTINKLVRIARAPKLGSSTQIHIWDRIVNEFGDIAVEHTYRIVISNNILRGSRGQTFKAQQELTNKNGSEVPKVLEAMVLCVVTFMSTGERLYNDAPETYSYCVEQVAGFSCHATVGAFVSDGLHVCHDFFTFPGALALGLFCGTSRPSLLN